jgi:hypothetical protein
MVWASQYRQYTAERIRSPRLEEPLNSYSSLELEHWVLVRRSANAGWKRDNVKITQSRFYREPHTLIGAACIVPGGRWLLVGDAERGSIMVYDLDASTLTGRLLIPPDGEGEQPAGHIVIEVDSEQQSSRLSFTMALMPYFHDSKTSICRIGIYLKFF